MWHPPFLRAKPAAIKEPHVNYQGASETDIVKQVYSKMLGNTTTGLVLAWFWQVTSLSTHQRK